MAELKNLFLVRPACDGYFIRGQYLIDGKILKFGIPNRKLVLFNRHVFKFPVVDDLDIPGMGEMEGHYQPVPFGDKAIKIGSLKSSMTHTAYADARAWVFRHEKYARWEVGMNRKNAWPADPVPWRQKAKLFLRSCRWRPEVIFFLNYIGTGAILDGKAGYEFAVSRYRYYKLIQNLAEKA